MPNAKVRRLVFFALETTLLTTAVLATAARILHRFIDQPVVALAMLALFVGSFIGLPAWCAVYHKCEPRLANVAAYTLIVLILWFFSDGFLPN